MQSPPEPPPAASSHEGFHVEPFTRSCRRLLARGEHAVIGVSAGNGYFTQARLVRLLGWAHRNFATVEVIYPDRHLADMHVASGCSPERASRRATRAVRDVRRRIRRAVEGTAATGRTRVRALSQCEELPGYQTARRRLDHEAATNPRVQRACEDHVRWLLGAEPDPDCAKLRAGLAYLRAELPFLLSTPEVLGVPSSVSCYHTLLPVLPRLRSVSACFHPNQGHVVVCPIDQTDAIGNPATGRTDRHEQQETPPPANSGAPA
ncbi:tRNA-dependent cyclodipeptide synthase [Streptomonospora sediminis]